MTRHIDTAEVAKIIRRRLKSAFPKTTFKVRSDRYAGGSSIRVGWTDGPTTAMVETITSQYGGRGFDGSIDMAYSIDHWLGADGSISVAYTPGTEGSRGYCPRIENPPHVEGAERVHFGSSSVSTSRELSAALQTRSLDKVRATLHLGEVDVSDVTFTETQKTYGRETFTRVEMSRDVYIPGWNAYLSDLVYRDARRRCAGL